MGGAGFTTSSLKLTDRFGDDTLRTRQPENAVADESNTTGDDPNPNRDHIHRRGASGGNDVNAASGVKNVHPSATNNAGGGGITTGPVSSRPSEIAGRVQVEPI